MLRTVLNGKIHRATVTGADLDYIGSITIDETLLAAADMLPFERVQVVDVTNGARLETYIIAGERDSGVIQLNGAAAHLVDVGDLVIIMSYAQVEDAEARDWKPKVVLVDAHNGITQTYDLPVEGGKPAEVSAPTC
jgi:aspartate 1-decarboxylase